MNEMLLHGEGCQTVHVLTVEDMGDFMQAIPSEAVTNEHAWLGREENYGVDFPDDSVTDTSHLESELRSSVATYEEGEPSTHVRLVRSAAGDFFAVAWQLGLRHMGSLRRCAAATAEPVQPQAAAAEHVPAPASETSAANLGLPTAGDLADLLEQQATRRAEMRNARE